MTPRIHNLDSFYAMIEKNIQLFQAYTRADKIAPILKICRMKPYEVLISRPAAKKLQLNKWWIDENGNSLKTVKGKRIKVILDDPELIDKKMLTTDLYSSLPLDKVAKMSKLLYLLIGKTKGEYKDHIIMAFLGLDNYLRVFTLIDGIWMKVAPIRLGLGILRSIVKNANTGYYKILANKKEVMVPCETQQSWLGYWPAKNKFLDIIENNNSIMEILGMSKKV